MSHCQTASPLFLFGGPLPQAVVLGRYLVRRVPFLHAHRHDSWRVERVVFPRRSASSVPRHVGAGTSLRHTHQSTNDRQSDRSPAPRLTPASLPSLPAANSPFLSHFPDPVSSPDRSSIAISVSRFRYCRSWVICLMPSGPSWSRQSVYATWLETSSRAWTASSLNPIIIALAGGVGFKTPFFPHMP